MSGFGGFVPVSNNAVHQPAIRPGGVEPPRNGPVPDEPPQDVPAGNARGAGSAQDLVRSLDILLAYADNPSGSNKSKVLDVLDDFRDDDRNKDWKAGLDFLLGANRSVQAENDPELHAALDAFKATFSFNKAMKTLVRQLENLVWNTEVMTDHLEALNLRAKSSDQRRIVRGRMMRQFNRLHWFDAITGQGDRHGANYMVQVKPDLTVVVKAIDNDGSFGATRTGLTKFRLPPAMARRYMDLVRNLSVGYGTAGKLALDAIKTDPGFTKLRDGSIEVDVSKATSPLTVTGLYESTAFHQVSVPDEMDFELCQKLKGLKAGPERDALLRDWADKLGARSQQYRNAVNRLDEAIARDFGD